MSMFLSDNDDLMYLYRLRDRYIARMVSKLAYDLEFFDCFDSTQAACQYKVAGYWDLPMWVKLPGDRYVHKHKFKLLW